MTTGQFDHIRENVRRLFLELPPQIELVAAAKQQSPEKILAAVEAGIKIVGENYVQEALSAYQVVGSRVSWSFIGHLQKNKVKRIKNKKFVLRWAALPGLYVTVYAFDHPQII